MDAVASMDVYSQYSVARIPCNDCNIDFSTQRAYVRHLQTDVHARNTGQNKKRKFPCDDCGHQFSRDADRQRHRDKRQCRGLERSEPIAPDFSVLSGNTDKHPHNFESLDGVILNGFLDAQNTVIRKEGRESGSPTVVVSGPSKSRFGSIAQSGGTDSGVDVTFDINLATITTAVDHWILQDQELLDAIEWSQPNGSSYSHRSLLQRRGKLASVPSRPVRMCAACKNVVEEGRVHVCGPSRDQAGEYPGSHACEVCHMRFVLQEDLMMHHRNAEGGHCGFAFAHEHACHGHHPPQMPDPLAPLDGHDDLRMCTSLRHWEDIQLRAYRAEAATFEALCETFSTCSIDVLDQQSLSSFAPSVKTYATAPCDKGKDGKTDIHGLYQRLQTFQHRQSSAIDAWTSDDSDYLMFYLSNGGRGLMRRRDH